MNKPKELWILKTPADETIEYDEPMNMDWDICYKTSYVEKYAYDELKCDLGWEKAENEKLRAKLAEADEFLENLESQIKVDEYCVNPRPKDWESLYHFSLKSFLVLVKEARAALNDGSEK